MSVYDIIEAFCEFQDFWIHVMYSLRLIKGDIFFFFEKIKGDINIEI